MVRSHHGPPHRSTRTDAALDALGRARAAGSLLLEYGSSRIQSLLHNLGGRFVHAFEGPCPCINRAGPIAENDTRCHRGTPLRSFLLRQPSPTVWTCLRMSMAALPGDNGSHCLIRHRQHETKAFGRHGSNAERAAGGNGPLPSLVREAPGHDAEVTGWATHRNRGRRAPGDAAAVKCSARPRTAGG